jgi:hypothetical protein
MSALAGNIRGLVTAPRDWKQENIVLSADYNFGAGGVLEFSYDREKFNRAYRERDETIEDKFKVGYNNTSLGDVSIRASYEYDDKTGSLYDNVGTTRSMSSWFWMQGIPYSRQGLIDMINANAPGTGFTPSVAQIAGFLVSSDALTGSFRKSDQADREQNILNLRVNWAATDTLDFGFNTQLKRASYLETDGRSGGLQKDDLDTFTLDANWQPSTATQISAFYTRQQANQVALWNYTNALNAANSTTVCGALTASNIDCFITAADDPTGNVHGTTKTDNDMLGLSGQYDAGFAVFGANYTYSKAESVYRDANAPGGTFYNNPLLLVPGIMSALGNPDPYPTMVTKTNTADLSVLVPIGQNVTIRTGYRYDGFHVEDWHYDPMMAARNGEPTRNGVNANTTNAQNWADLGPQDFKIHTLSVMLGVKF